MAEDTHQFFSQMDKKKKILEKIRKAIYDDMLWEDNDARYVSCLEPESLDDVERECCLLVLNLVSSTLSCIRQPRPRLILLATVRSVLRARHSKTYK